MLKLCAIVSMLIFLVEPAALEAATSVFKCSKNGSVTYQSDPCPTEGTRRVPTVDQLNAERQKRLREAASNAPSSTASSSNGNFSSSPVAISAALPLGDKERQGSSSAVPVSPSPLYKCDGRIHCSQMTSCSEAKYFLSNCPGVKMDGDGDGIPCEDQWCR